MIWDWFANEYLPHLADSFVDPHKRVSAIYLLSAIVIALCWAARSSRKPGPGGLAMVTKALFGRDALLSRSARGDYKLLLINKAILMLAWPSFALKATAATALYFFFTRTFGADAPLAGWPAPVAAGAYTLFLFVLDDFSRFLVHLALHRVRLLWAFHKTHHTAETLSPFTVYRTHPVESVIFSLRSIAVQALSISLFLYMFGKSIDLVSIYGVNVLLFLFNITGANLRHSSLPISYGRFFERIFISPAQHQIHHSPFERHRDRNFGAALAIWDGMFGSLHFAERETVLRYGLTDAASPRSHGLRALYLSPLAEAWRIVAAPVRRRLRPLSARTALAPVLAAAILPCWSGDAGAAELNVYSHRQPFLIQPFLKAFEQKTGVKVNVVFAAKGLVQRMLAEGPRSPADVVLTVDIGRLYAYADKDLLSPVNSKTLEQNIPPHLRDSRNRWFGLSKRARVVAIAQDRVKPAEISRIEDLADPRWKGRICTRPGSHVYNRALLASLIAANGEKAAEQWARSLVANLARRPQGNDRAQVKAVFEGVCDVAIINSYYFGQLRHAKSSAQRKWAEKVGIVFTNQNDRGNHVNISGGGVARYSKNRDNAIRLLEFLTEQTSQKLYGEVNFEFPVNPAISPSAEIRSWGTFHEDKLPIGRIAELASAAQKIIDRVGW